MPWRRARIRSISSQNWRRDSGSTPVVGSSRIRRSGSWIRQQQSPSFCRMPPDKFFAGRSAKGASPVLWRSSRDSRVPFGTGLSEQAAEELDILADAEFRIKILAQSLRHIGNAGADRVPMCRIPPCRHRGRKRFRIESAALRQSMLSSDDFPTPSGPINPTMQPTGSSTETRVESDRFTVSLRDVLDARDQSLAPDHCVACPCSATGHFTAASVNT